MLNFNVGMLIFSMQYIILESSTQNIKIQYKLHSCLIFIDKISIKHKNLIASILNFNTYTN